jgi:phospholipid-binding lipoprotein MlaA
MIRIVAALALICVLAGCASSGNPNDPFEGYNRAMYSFNDKLDKYALKPTAQAYQTVTPSFVQTGIGNFFGNLADVWTAVNNLLQGKGSDGMSDLGRVIINSTLGLGGLIDIGTEAGLPKHKEDFGQTLGKWGVKPGPYIVLPLLGPSTLRDTVALPVDFKGDLWLYEDPVRVRNTGSVIRVVDKRASLLDAGNLIEDAALDPYQFMRDAYLQRRKNQVYDGDIPDDDDDKPADKLQGKPESGSGDNADKLKENAK